MKINVSDRQRVGPVENIGSGLFFRGPNTQGVSVRGAVDDL